jgi:hypothetical protein
MVYEYTGDSVAAVSTAAASSSTSAAASSTSISMPTGTPAIVPVVGAYSYTGCVNDIDTRILTGDHTASDTMTIEDCASYCSGYQYFGLEYTRECSSPIPPLLPFNKLTSDKVIAETAFHPQGELIPSTLTALAP